MKKTPWLLVEPCRKSFPGYESRYGDAFGAFAIPRHGVMLWVLVSDGEGAREDLGDDYAWDHVSVSVKDRCPTWEEMSYVKSLFFENSETVVQFHVPSDAHVNRHIYTLHMWRPLLVRIPRPPKDMV